MKAKTYIETSVVSYLTAMASRDLVLAAQQRVTQEWWATRGDFEIFVSQFVLDEAGRGDPWASARRLSVLKGIPLLDVEEDVSVLAEELLRQRGFPAKARVDALHVAVATAHGMDYLLTWNCRHIANAMLRGKIEEVCRSQGFRPPVICTPLELIQES